MRIKRTIRFLSNIPAICLEENEVVTECSIQTSEADETLDFDFVSANVCNKVIIK
uniref:Uncharacterized protein n=1 Tax=Amphimedon queenslandica TaxID=400682 RepID=A0A1X7SEX1_AMPQE